MTPLDLGQWFAAAAGGSMLLALPVALLAGLVSFFSPCVLPLLPGYLSYATGLAATDVTSGKGSRGRMLAGTSLFILGFAFVFVSTGALFGGLGGLLLTYSRPISIAIGVLTIVLGLVFAGVVGIGQRTFRISKAPAVGLAAAPLLGIVFGLGWTPCIGPTLAVVMSLAINEGTALRGAVLALVYALGLGIPFVVAGLAFDRFAGTMNWVKKRHELLQKIGGGMMVIVGLLLVTGLWDALMGVFRQWASAWGLVI
ncbi:cytochrome c biogenesis protein CcdA [Propioniciclava coleopterorum]|uniref:Cytochrome c biogenesis protein CcdA n=1 Tax=Propioniciclava coleopterorum TaxID=2714937 RepID=A0A6G7Y4D8_9ACTN|nr:cytochrome c biogenesis protein CcdA [Propioniciclava coleopterorum]